ncbi:hypothetical protein CDD81_1587 [Ophiocordyceps australis]|uniref:Cytochrome b5 heme-binding domain-containing protein n=1 Tax=Ophiocordyceps australis TaxID=1399860 RepID=A0A2C5XZH5_9HYPO|nr:hypothetical protein CDD81_1587 [Ophiocordyceps australis]
MPSPPPNRLTKSHRQTQDSMADSQLRQRKPPAGDNDGNETHESKHSPNDDDSSHWMDFARVLTFVLLASCGLSYVISGGESWLWGFKNKPNYLRVEWWKAQLSGPIYLTPQELMAYDGSDATKPLYLAINGTIYDVSAGRHMYGPGGSYSVFAGHDAARAFVTGCFAEDRTPDMRGVEEMFLPLDDAQVDAQWSAVELDRLRADELAQARDRAHKALKHWVDFFAKSKRYHRVGYVKRAPNWLHGLPRRQLCAQAHKGRTKRRKREDL